MKNYLWVAVWAIILAGFSFAQTTGQTTTGTTQNVMQTFTNSRATLLSGLDKNRDDLLTLDKNFVAQLDKNSSYSILKQLGVITGWSLQQEILSNYFSTKSSFLTDYNSLVSADQILTDKKSSGFMTDEDYQIEKKKLDADMQSFISKYNTLIASYKTTATTKLWSVDDTIQTAIQKNSTLISAVNSNVDQLSGLMAKYTNYQTFKTRVNAIYLGNFENYSQFSTSVRDVLISTMDEQLTKIFSQYVNSNNYLTDSADKFDTQRADLVNSFKVAFDEYANELFEWFYQQDAEKFIEASISTLKTQYYSGSQINYAKIQDLTALNQLKTDLSARMDLVIKTAEDKLKEFDNPSDVNAFKTALKAKFETFFATKLTEFSATYIQSLNDEKQLYTLKSEKQQTAFKEIAKNKDAAFNATGDASSRYFYYTNYLKQLQEFKKNNDIVDSSIAQEVDSQIWQLEVKRIDTLVTIDKLTKFNLKYKDVDASLAAIFVKLAKEATDKWNAAAFDQKLVTALTKIEAFLSTPSVSWETKYLLYKIKRAIIVFKYLS